MNGRLLDKDNNDLIVVTDESGNRHVARASSFKERTMRKISTILHTFEGECFTNYEAGVPWFDSILGNSVLFADEISQEIKDKILAVDGVVDVVDMIVEIDGRNISGKYKVKLSDGSVEMAEI